jgi:hypothetical protein
MPVDVKVIHAREFIQATATGVLDFAASEQALLDIVSRIQRPGDYEVLMDLRGAEVQLSMIERYELGTALANHPSMRQSKIALLVPMNEMDNARFLETVAHNRGVRVMAFTGFEQAITWLVMQESAS